MALLEVEELMECGWFQGRHANVTQAESFTCQEKASVAAV